MSSALKQLKMSSGHLAPERNCRDDRQPYNEGLKPGPNCQGSYVVSNSGAINILYTVPFCSLRILFSTVHESIAMT